MSRYIDADEFADFIKRWGQGSSPEDVIEWLQTGEAADVVEVVRCPDCKHNHIKSWNQGKRDNPSCYFTDFIRSNEFYCGFGERAEE